MFWRRISNPAVAAAIPVIKLLIEDGYVDRNVLDRVIRIRDAREADGALGKVITFRSMRGRWATVLICMEYISNKWRVSANEPVTVYDHEGEEQSFRVVQLRRNRYQVTRI